MYKVDEETDVVYSVTSAVGPVSSRDFVSLRQISRRDGFFISASVATTFSQKPPQPGKVRYDREGRERGRGREGEGRDLREGERGIFLQEFMYNEVIFTAPITLP